MSPLLGNVPGAFQRIADRGRSLTIDRAGVVLPAGGHFQGIQRIASAPRRLVVTSSSNSAAYFLICDMFDDTRGRARPPVTAGVSPMDHAGGCQVAGDVLAVGVEDDNSRQVSEVQFWHLGGVEPARLGAQTIPRRGAPKVSTAGAVGVSAYRGGAALAVGTWDADTIDFYLARRDPFARGATPFAFHRTWSKDAADKTGWIDQNYGSYQSVNLLAQRDGKLYLTGFHRDGGGDDWMDLYAVDLDAPAPRMLRKVGKKHMYCGDGCSFRDGAGVYVPSAAGFEVYAVKGLSGDHRTGTTINVNHFQPR